MTRVGIAAALVGMLVTIGCYRRVQVPRFRQPEAEFRAATRVICVLPPQLGFSLARGKELTVKLRDELQQIVATGGFEVPPPSEVDKLWQGTVASLGGAYDIYSGRLDRTKRQEILAASRDRLKADLKCDALLSATVSLVNANFFAGVAAWDGVRESLRGDGSGYVGAISLWVSIEDMNGKEQFFGTGGIQVLSHLDPGFFETKFEAVDEEQVLTDAGARRAAIYESLRTLVPVPTPTPRGPRGKRP